MPTALLAPAGVGTQTLVAAVAGKRIRVKAFVLTSTAGGGSDAKFQSDGTPTDLTGSMRFSITGPIAIAAAQPGLSLFETLAGEALDLVIATSGNVAGFFVYDLV